MTFAQAADAYAATRGQLVAARDAAIAAYRDGRPLAIVRAWGAVRRANRAADRAFDALAAAERTTRKGA